MSFKLVGQAFDIPLKGNDKLVFLALCEYANDDDYTCYPSINTLMKKATISKGGLSYCLNVLENLGLISRQARRRENGSSTSTQYTINSSMEFDQNLYKNRKDLIQKVEQSSESEQGSKVQKVNTPCSESEHPKGGQSSESEHLEPLAYSLNPYSNPKKSKPKKFFIFAKQTHSF